MRKRIPGINLKVNLIDDDQFCVYDCVNKYANMHCMPDSIMALPQNSQLSTIQLVQLIKTLDFSL